MATLTPLEVRIDFIFLLPPELVLGILVHLPIADVLRCLRVSSVWHESITEATSFWKGPALKSLGVSDYVVLQSGRHYKTCKDLAVRVHNNRRYIQLSSPEAKQMSKIYLNHYFQCNYFKYGVLVGTMYEDFVPIFTSVSTMIPSTGLLKQTHSFLPALQESAHRVVWCSLYCDYILLASAIGKWRGFNLVTGEALLSWQGPTLYDPEQIFCCCQDCYLVGMGKMIVNRHQVNLEDKAMYWELQILRIGRGHVRPTVSQVRLGITLPGNSIPGNSVLMQYCKSIGMISKSKDKGSSHFCRSHWLVLQCGSSLCIHQVASSNHQETVSTVPLVDLNHSISETFLIDKHHSTPFVLPFDQSLLALATNGKVQVWTLNDFKCVSSFGLQSLQDGVQISILGIGHVYIVIGYGSIKGKVQILSTYTGEVIFSVHGFSGLGEASTIGIPPPYFTFLGLTDEEWLNKVDVLPNSHLPSVLYWDKMKHCVFGIILSHGDEKRMDSQMIVNAEISSNSIIDKFKNFIKRY